jgi:hypothetical protein
MTKNKRGAKEEEEAASSGNKYVYSLGSAPLLPMMLV